MSGSLGSRYASTASISASLIPSLERVYTSQQCMFPHRSGLAVSTSHIRQYSEREISPRSDSLSAPSRQQRAEAISQQVQAMSRPPRASSSRGGTPYRGRERAVGGRGSGEQSNRARLAVFDKGTSRGGRPPRGGGFRGGLRGRGGSMRGDSGSRQTGRFRDDDRGQRDDEDEVPTLLGHLQLLEQFDKDHAADVPFDAPVPTEKDYIRSGQGTATVAGGNYEGVMEDLIKRVAETNQDALRYPPQLAKRMLKRGYVDLGSETERDAVVAAAKFRQDMHIAAVAAKTGKPAAPIETEFAPIGAKQRTDLVNRFVRGQADMHEGNVEDRILGPLSVRTMVNSSYRMEHAATFEAIMRSLMPRSS